MRTFLLGTLVALGTQGAAPASIDTPHLTVTVSPAARTASPGTRVELSVDVAPKAKMHVYAPQQKDYIPISLTLKPSALFSAGTVVYPRPETYLFAPLNETQLVYSKRFRISQPITLARGAAMRAAGVLPGGAVTVTGTLRYQACDDAICYMPKEVPVSWRVVLAEARQKNSMQ